MQSRAVGLLVGALADALFADPARWHPVAGFGSCAAALERRWYADRRSAGVAHTVVLVGAVVGLGVAAEVVGRRHPVAHTCLTAAATWAVLGGTSLAAHGTALADALEGESGVRSRHVGDLGTAKQGESGVWARRVGDSRTARAHPQGESSSSAQRVGDSGTARPPHPQGESSISARRVGDLGTARPPHPQGESSISAQRVGDLGTGGVGCAKSDLAAARALIPALCGRAPEALDAAGMARAGTESMAENTSDAAVAPLLWGAVAGIPGLLGYRAVNTLDAMVGYRSPRYARFGWAAARSDDLVNLVPSRMTALLLALLAPAIGGSPRAAIEAWRRDATQHPSPNAGPVEAAAAGALGVALGGLTVYPHGIENRPRLGRGRPPTSADLRRAARLSQFVGAAAALLAAALARLPRYGGR